MVWQCDESVYAGSVEEAAVPLPTCARPIRKPETARHGRSSSTLEGEAMPPPDGGDRLSPKGEALPLPTETALPRPNEEGMPPPERAAVTPIVESTPGELV